MRIRTIRWQRKSVCSFDFVVNAFLAGHRRLGLSTLGNEVFASLYLLFAKDWLFKKGGELGLGSDWEAKSDHVYFSALFRRHTSPHKVCIPFHS